MDLGISFGVNLITIRAKTITNKAKANVDLSPSELKAMLRKIKGDYSTSVAYCGELESEVGIWRSGGTVPQSDWVSLQNLRGNSSNGTAEPPTSRPSTPVNKLGSDERDDFLKRENELSDQLQVSEASIKKRDEEIEALKEEVSFLKGRESSIAIVCVFLCLTIPIRV